MSESPPPAAKKTLLVTGATGFLGRAVVAAASSRGHRVLALIRPGSRFEGTPLEELPGVEPVRGDLRRAEDLAEPLTGVDAVIHLAAVKSGDFYDQMAGTVIATERLLEVIRRADVRRLVLTSSFSVYDFYRMRSGALLAEDSPLEAHPELRDDYAKTKLIQERLCREFADEASASGPAGFELVVLRPGMIFGPGNLWNAYIGIPLGARRWLRIGAGARLPMTYLENCAEAVVIAAEHANAAGGTFNIIDDEMPTVRRFAAVVRAYDRPPRSLVPFPFWAMRLLARSAAEFNRLALGGRARTPSILVPQRLHARGKPLRYTNRRIKETLGWQPRYPLEEAVRRSVESPRHAPAEGAGA